MNSYNSPFLKQIKTKEEYINKNIFPFNMPIFSKQIDLTLNSSVTFFVGENGSGKSTLLEAIAQHCGFSLAGGSSSHYWNTAQSEKNSALMDALILSWYPKKIRQGFFLRAENLFNFANYIDELAKDDPFILKNYGGKSLHQQSHGEAFLTLFKKFKKGLFLLDEPEAALSPTRQLGFLSIIHELTSNGNCQFIIATHSPILFSYPDSALLYFNEKNIKEMNYKETEHYILTKNFLDNPNRYFKHLF
jgi:predicted ATPase